MSLTKYQHKRDFAKTPEPKGKVRHEPSGIFVVQKHQASQLHYDFRLELNGVLKSWAIPKGPSYDPKLKHLAIEVEDHPLEYGSFEGNIPEGEYGAGTVMLWDKGSFEPIHDLDQDYKKGLLKFTLKGHKLKGGWSLVRIRNIKGKAQWLLIKMQDEYAHFMSDEALLNSNSVVSNRNMLEIKHG